MWEGSVPLTFGTQELYLSDEDEEAAAVESLRGQRRLFGRGAKACPRGLIELSWSPPPMDTGAGGGGHPAGVDGRKFETTSREPKPGRNDEYHSYGQDSAAATAATAASIAAAAASAAAAAAAATEYDAAAPGFPASLAEDGGTKRDESESWSADAGGQQTLGTAAAPETAFTDGYSRGGDAVDRYSEVVSRMAEEADAAAAAAAEAAAAAAAAAEAHAAFVDSEARGDADPSPNKDVLVTGRFVPAPRWSASSPAGGDGAVHAAVAKN